MRFATLSPNSRPDNLGRVVLVGSALLIVAGLFSAQSAEEFGAYFLVTATAAIPGVLWLLAGARAIPTLAVVSVFYFLFYALPILRHQATLAIYSSTEILYSAITVATFLFSATFSWRLFWSGQVSRPFNVLQDPYTDTQLQKFILLGFLIGSGYYMALYLGLLNALGSYIGLIRQAAFAAATVACYLLGHARARGWIRGQKWALHVFGFVSLLILSCVSLYLIGALILCLAAVFGYVFTCKRVPWVLLGVAVTIVTVLNAGKEQMRKNYWLPNSTDLSMQISVFEVPGLLVEWMGIGLERLTSGEEYGSAADRASLLPLLLRVQRATPSQIPFLGGATYALLPALLVPRFIDPEKPASRAGTNMLNVRYGIQSEAATENSTIGWGLIPEAYANFGYLGVISIGFLFGAMCVLFERLSNGAKVVSLPSLLAIVATVQFTDIEENLAELITSLLQSLVVTYLFYVLFQLVQRRSAVVHRSRPVL